jgi:hypothetical protein
MARAVERSIYRCDLRRSGFLVGVESVVATSRGRERPADASRTTRSDPSPPSRSTGVRRDQPRLTSTTSVRPIDL